MKTIGKTLTIRGKSGNGQNLNFDIGIGQLEVERNKMQLIDLIVFRLNDALFAMKRVDPNFVIEKFDVGNIQIEE